jgi:hypothetical protein
VFVHALAATLDDYAIAKRVESVEVERRRLEARILWKKSKTRLTMFRVEPVAKYPSMEVEARLEGKALIEIAALLAERENKNDWARSSSR